MGSRPSAATTRAASSRRCGSAAARPTPGSTPKRPGSPSATSSTRSEIKPYTQSTAQKEIYTILSSTETTGIRLTNTCIITSSVYTYIHTRNNAPLIQLIIYLILSLVLAWNKGNYLFYALIFF